MAATREDLSIWFDEGVKVGATHMVIVTDEFDWEDFPVYVTPGENAREVVADYTAKPMHKVMEVYNLGMGKAPQMAEDRAFHYD